MNRNEEENIRVKYRVKRLTYTQSDFGDEFQSRPKTPFTFSSFMSALRNVRLSTFGFELFPIFKSLPTYYNFHYFFLDLITGITMAFFHLPQGNYLWQIWYFLNIFQRYGIWISCWSSTCQWLVHFILSRFDLLLFCHFSS